METSFQSVGENQEWQQLHSTFRLVCSWLACSWRKNDADNKAVQGKRFSKDEDKDHSNKEFGLLGICSARWSPTIRTIISMKTSKSEKYATHNQKLYPCTKVIISCIPRVLFHMPKCEEKGLFVTENLTSYTLPFHNCHSYVPIKEKLITTIHWAPKPPSMTAFAQTCFWLAKWYIKNFSLQIYYLPHLPFQRKPHRNMFNSFKNTHWTSNRRYVNG